MLFCLSLSLSLSLSLHAYLSLCPRTEACTGGDALAPNFVCGLQSQALRQQSITLALFKQGFDSVIREVC
jgi:hypothetical protein